MSLDRRISVARFLHERPWAAEVFAWHGVNPDLLDGRWSVATLCLLCDLDEVRLVRDLVAMEQRQAIDEVELRKVAL